MEAFKTSQTDGERRQASSGTRQMKSNSPLLFRPFFFFPSDSKTVMESAAFFVGQQKEKTLGQREMELDYFSGRISTRNALAIARV